MPIIISPLVFFFFPFRSNAYSTQPSQPHSNSSELLKCFVLYVPCCSPVAPQHNHLFASCTARLFKRKATNDQILFIDSLLHSCHSERPIPPWQPAAEVSWSEDMHAFGDACRAVKQQRRKWKENGDIKYHRVGATFFKLLQSGEQKG